MKYKARSIHKPMKRKKKVSSRKKVSETRLLGICFLITLFWILAIVIVLPL
jgi:hypothetical protein